MLLALIFTFLKTANIIKNSIIFMKLYIAKGFDKEVRIFINNKKIRISIFLLLKKLYVYLIFIIAIIPTNISVKYIVGAR